MGKTRDPYLARERRRRREKWRKYGSITGVIVLFLTTALLLPQYCGPQASRFSALSTEPSADAQALESLRAVIGSLEEQLFTAQQTGASREVVLSSMQALFQARESYLKQAPLEERAAELSALQELEVQWHTYAAQPLLQEAESLELDADTAGQQGHWETAEAQYSQAYSILRQVNTDYPRSQNLSPIMLSRLAQKRANAQARPLEESLETLREQARSALQAQQWREAEAFLRSALSLHTRIRQEHPDASYASPTRRERLERELQSVAAAEMAFHLSEQQAQIDVSLTSGDSQAEADAFERALRIQTRINEVHGNTPYASMQKQMELRNGWMTALSRDEAMRLLELDTALGNDLAEGKMAQARRQLSALHQGLERFRETYPQSSLWDEARWERVEYLQSLGDALGWIQQHVYERLQPLPAGLSGQLYRQEVSQSLYTRVMGVNPSASSDPNLPVDSVTWREAQTFCQRLGWILQRKVALPDEAIYRQLLAEVDRRLVDNTAWHSANSGRVTQAVAGRVSLAGGFYDLLGNVAEWLAAPSGATEAPVMGGSVRDNPLRLVELPYELRDVNERQRFVGFRFIVE